jgi:D-alanine-D-alanine ligase
MKKKRVLVLYGGQSSEHQVSLISALSVLRHLNRDRYEVLAAGIDREGKLWAGDSALIQKALSDSSQRSLPELLNQGALALRNQSVVAVEADERGLKSWAPGRVDIVFPVMHGPYCEDGTVQGMLEIANLAYVGCGVLSSALGMDKEVAKRLVSQQGIPVTPWIALRAETANPDDPQLADRVQKELGYPCFVKPVNAGSSVGVSKVKSPSELSAAIAFAFRFDRKVLIEKGVAAREIEFSVLEDRKNPGVPRVSIAGEIVPKREFYSYEAKYFDENGAELKIPADLNAQEMAYGQEMARRVFLALECEGMARVDFFLDRVTGEWFFNEVNTIPGFTHISMYPKLWEASGLAYSELLDELIEVGLSRFEKRSRLSRSPDEKVGGAGK